MPAVGVRELKTHASEILRHVRDQRAYYTVTYRGKPVGILSPLPEPNEPSTHDAWAELDRLGKELSHAWKSPLSSTEILSEMRR